MRLRTRLAGVGAAALAAWIGYRLVALAFLSPTPAPKPVRMFGPNVEMLTRLDAKRRIADEVIAGRLTLLDAAAAFKALDAEGCLCPGAVVPPITPPRSEAEVYCRMAIGWVRGEAPEGRADDLTRPLEAELAARLRDGTLRLPD